MTGPRYCGDCAVCGTPYASAQPRAKYCSRTCKNAATNAAFDEGLYRYGVSKARLAEMLQEQGGGCAICGTAEGPWTVDHDHACCPTLGRRGRRARACGKCNRGVLCVPCNTLLGMARDDVGTLMAAAAYLLARENVLAAFPEGI